MMIKDLIMEPVRHPEKVVHLGRVINWVGGVIALLLSYPSQSFREVSYLRQLLAEYSRVRVLEWGAGNSTLYYSRYLSLLGIPYEWVAIEHNERWAELVRSRSGERVQLYHQLEDYVDFPTTLGKFDVIIIDGIKRDECLEVALGLREEGGVILRHDCPCFKWSKPWAMTYRRQE